MNSNNKSVQLAALFAVTVLAMGTMQIALADGNETKLESQLTGDALSSGKAKFEERLDRMKFSVEAEDLPANTEFTITAPGFSKVITSDALGGFDLNLDSRLGHSVPALEDGDVVTVSGGGIEISGTLRQ